MRIRELLTIAISTVAAIALNSCGEKERDNPPVAVPEVTKNRSDNGDAGPEEVDEPVTEKVPAAVPEVRTIVLPARNTSQAFDPASGSVVAVDAERNQVRLYQREFFKGNENAVLGPINVPECPGHSVFKSYKGKHYLFVPGYTDGCITVFNSLDMSVVKVVDLPMKRNTTTFCSQDPDDPWLYFCGTHGKCGRIHVETMEFSAWLKPGIEAASRPRICAKGKTIYTTQGAFGFMDRDSDQEEVVIRPVHTVRWDFNGAIPDQAGKWAGMDIDVRRSGIFDPQLRKRHGAFDFPVIGFDSANDLIIGEIQGTLHVASLSNFETQAVFETGAVGRWETRDNFYRPFFDYKTEAYPDPEAGHLVVLRRDQKVVVISNALLNPDKKPIIQMAADVPDSVPVGRLVELSIKVSKDVEEVAEEILPDGMTLEDNVLKWTPGEAQIGENKVSLKLSGKGVSKIETIRLWVERPFLELPFEASSVVASEDGRVIVVWDDFYRIASIDGENLTVMANTKLEKGRRILKIITDGSHVFVQREHASEIEIYAAKDLKRVRSLGARTQILDMEVVPGGEFLAVKIYPPREDGSSREKAYSMGTRLYRLPELTVPRARSISERLRTGVWRKDVVPSPSYTDESERLVFSVGDYQRVGTLVYDKAFQRICLLQESTFHNVLKGVSGYIPSYSWGRAHNRNSLLRFFPSRSAKSKQIKVLNEKYDGTSLSFIPGRMALVFYQWKFSHELETLISAGLSIFEIKNGEQTGDYPLVQDLPLAQDGRSPRLKQPLAATRDAIFTIFERRLYRFDLIDEMFADCEMPLHFEPVQSKLVVETDRVSVLEHQVQGGKPPYRFELTNQVFGLLSIDEKTGHVSVDGKAAADYALESLFGINPNTLELNEHENHQRNFLAKYAGLPALETYAETFEEISGRAPVGLPVTLPVMVSVNDSDGDVQYLSYLITFELDRPIIDKVAESLRKAPE